MHILHLAAACGILLAGCVQGQPPTTTSAFNFAPSYRPAGMTHSETVGLFSIHCQKQTTSGTGKRIGKDECILAQGTRLHYETLRIVADSRGVRVENPSSPDTRVCGYGPKNHGVDGISMNGKSTSEQIRLLSSGSTYFKEGQRLWPECRVYTAEFNLEGFPEAYRRFVAAYEAAGF